MVTCKLDPQISGEVLGYKVSTTQALFLHRVLPSCGGLVVYLTVMCYDIALIYEHYDNGHSGVGAFCIVLMALPAFISLMFTLASAPSLQPEMSAYSINIQKKDAKWIALQCLNCLFFPIAAIGRYCHQIFWWTEAVFATRAQDKDRLQEALSTAKTPSPMELYLFLQAFIHSAPHAVVNILDLMARFNDPVFGKVSVQAVSIVASMLRMSSTATMYRRFEREKLSGRKYPWIVNDTHKLLPNDDGTAEKLKEEPIYEPIFKERSVSPENLERTNINSDLIQFSPIEAKNSPWEDNYSDSGTSSDYIPPPDALSGTSQRVSVNSDEEYMRPISIINRVAPIRRDTQFTIERVEITPPPAIPAPRPMSFAAWAEKMVENAESIPTWLSAPPRRRHGDHFIIPEEPELPRRVPRSYMRGLEPQDATAALTQFLGWYTFFISRLLSIAAFINCVPVFAIIVLMSHYQIMLLLLIVPQASTVRRGFYIFLAFIYLFCLMEFKIRFRHVRVWHVFWIIVCTIETIVFIALWTHIGNDFGEWWTMYVVKVVTFSMLFSYMCFLVYFVLLQPRETFVCINENKVSTK